MPVKNRLTLAKIHNAQVIHYRRTGHLDKAEAAFIQCRTLLEGLLVDDPKDAKSLAFLAGCHNTVGLVYAAKGDIRAGEAAYQKAVALFQQLTRDDPEDVILKKGLAQTLNNLGGLYAQDRQHAKATAPFQQSLDLNKAVFDAHPNVLAYRLELAGSYVGMATHIRRTGSVEESLTWTAQAIEIVEPVLKQHPRNVQARFYLFNMLMGRGYAFTRLERREDAAKDWRRMIEISEGQADILMRLYRPFALVFLGDHARATAEIETLVAEGRTQGRNLFLFAVVHSLASAAVADDARLPPAERQKLADTYGGRAIEMLRKARAAGLFKNPGQLAELKESKDLKTVRSRPDFQKLLVELETEAKPKP
jgi:tetratricopeptide (TPR) repeat protein